MKYWYVHDGGTECLDISTKKAKVWRNSNPGIELITDSKFPESKKQLTTIERTEGDRLKRGLLSDAIHALLMQANHDRLQGKELVQPLDDILGQWLKL